MAIGQKDVNVSKKLRAYEDRKAKLAARSSKDQGLQASPAVPEEKDVSLSSTDSDCNYSEGAEEGKGSGPSGELSLNIPESEEPLSCSKQMRLKLPSVALACNRTGVSDRAAAIIANAVLEDVGLLPKEDNSMIIDRMKIRRARTSKRLSVTTKLTTLNTSILGLFFDGRKDQTLINKRTGNMYQRKRITEEHVSIISEPASKYLGHVVPETGSALHVKQSIMTFFEQRDFSTTDLIAVGCDGTVVNTGSKNGVIRLLEKELGRPLQWLICLFHFNELPLRHLVKELDSETSGPRGLKGIIGQKLEQCEPLPVTEFKTVESNLPEMDDTKCDLSTDQNYLFEIVKSIERGDVSLSLALRYPGKLSHARWLTTANRILRLFVATEVPSEPLCILTNYIMKVYAPFWFRDKLQPSCFEGARHLFKLIESCRFLPEHIQKIIHSVVQRNGFFAHPENILLSLLTDEDPVYNNLGIRRILKARDNKRTGVRAFTVPRINFQASHYFELIFWHEINITEPPVTTNIEISLSENAKSKLRNLPAFPCNTQAVERVAIRTVKDLYRPV